MSIRHSLAATLAAAAAMLALLLAGPPAHSADLDAGDVRALDRISGWLNANPRLQAAFVQINPDGTIVDGTVYMWRPGRMRFEYRPPTPIRVIADGTWVVLEDMELDTQDRYPLSATPLSLLLDDEVDLKESALIEDVTRADGTIRVTARDRDNPDQGRIVIVFNEEPLALRQWIITDTQGQRTTVALKDVRTGMSLDPRLFVANDPLPQGPR
ncbi:LolA family protein [Futiania mangrovi]|uniref:Outer membrane lipoprotein carrier protein LolA n=1 Tax=Futiania mangrovi TaxID=2959716 RepID=A0A9J6P9D3_9PROT|nr:outer membrane lipoprotein carrier protein LolA [Futiania mangrovii]MCP1336524.1 outer membrane lipoprotein carrier protein LolA [Futiania mangrovii]